MAALATTPAAAKTAKSAVGIALRTSRDTSESMRIGKKQVYMPSNMIAMLAPREKQPPIFATFKVPLTFNKFDMRDYLLHVYNTPVVAVRAQLRQLPIQPAQNKGRIYRPPPVKTMTVQLKEPFVWPGVPDDLEPWTDSALVRGQLQQRREKQRHIRAQKKSLIPLRDQYKEEPPRKNLRAEAERLIKEGGWTHKRELDPRFEDKSKTEQTGKSGAAEN